MSRLQEEESMTREQAQDKAIEVLVKLLESNNEAVRLEAAQTLLRHNL